MSRLLLSLLLLISGLSAHATEKPSILWIYAEDTSPWMGCYGDVINAGATPHIDSIADSGVRFTRAYVPAPVCSATRSAMMVGQNAIRFGGHEHRSSRGASKIHLPEAYQLLPKLLQNQGYTTFNHGKTDYNYVWDATIYNYAAKSKTDFSDLVRRQPFFGQIQTKGGKNNTWKFPANRKVDPRPGQWIDLDQAVQTERPDHMHWLWDFGPQTYDEEQFADHIDASWAIGKLQQAHDRPFLPTIGFYRPHMPFFAPQRVYDHPDL
jgi:arylsulfatase A-like enzyme